MAVKASVDTGNQTTVRVGQQNATQVTSTQTGITYAATAGTAFNVVGGISSVTQLSVSGISTLGIVTAIRYYGDGSNLTGTGNTTDVSTNSLVVLGISTFNNNIHALSNVGIGTDDPTSKLTIATDGTANPIEATRYNADDGGATIFLQHSRSDTVGVAKSLSVDDEIGSIEFRSYAGNDTSLSSAANIKAVIDADPTDTKVKSALVFETSSAGISGTADERLRITSDGNVGIGTVSPEKRLDIWNTSGPADLRLKTTANSFNSFTFDSARQKDTQFAIIDGRWNGNDVARIQFVTGSDDTNYDDGYMAFHTRKSGETLSERLRITSAGKVGIGTDNPTAHFQVYRATQYASNPIIQARSNNGSTNELKFEIDGDGDAYFNGKVGIGTINPQAKLDVDGSLNVTGVSTFNQDVNFPGAAYNILWDQATSKFKFDDSAQLVFGSASGGDMKLFHQSGNSTIRNETGQFRIAGNDIRLQTQNHSEDYLLAVDGGSVSIFYNDVKRLETSGIGITVTGVTSTTDLYVTGVSTFTGNINANGNIIGDNATNITGINSVTATSFYGDGSGLDNTGATLSAASGTQRLVLTSLTSGTMVSAATDGDLTFQSSSNLLSAGKLLVAGISTFTGDITANGNIVGDNATNITGIAGVTASTLTGTLQTAAQPNVTSVGTLTSLDVTGNVSIGGTLTYDDVTNVDSIGIITARQGIHVLAGAGVSIAAGGLNVSSGISTFAGDVNLGSSGTNTITITGVVDSDIVPTGTTRDLGSSTSEWRNLFIDGIAYIDDLRADTAKIGDLTDNRVVLAGSEGELEDDANLTFNGSTLSVGVALNISGIATLAGITTVTGETLFTKQLSVSGLSTYIGVATYKSDVFVDGTLTAGAIDGGTY